VVEGRVRATRGDQQQMVTPGETLGVLEVCADDDELAAVAETETLTLSVSGDVFLDLLEDNFTIFHQLLRRICTMRIEQGGDLFADAHAGDVSRYSSIPRARELDLVERIVFLRRCFAFARGRLSALAELSQHVTEVHFEPRAPIWSEGDPSGHLLLVVRGGIACTPPGAREAFRYGPEGATGTLEAIAAQPRWFTATAEDGGLQALRLDVEHLLDVFEDNFEMARGYLRYVSRQALGTLRRGSPGPLRRTG
jgi:CRP-like cAMP-binding protein